MQTISKEASRVSGFAEGTTLCVGVGAFERIEEGADKMIFIDKEYKLINENVKIYNNLYKVYCKAYKGLDKENVFNMLANLQN